MTTRGFLILVCEEVAAHTHSCQLSVPVHHAFTHSRPLDKCLDLSLLSACLGCKGGQTRETEQGSLHVCVCVCVCEEDCVPAEILFI